MICVPGSRPFSFKKGPVLGNFSPWQACFFPEKAFMAFFKPGKGYKIPPIHLHKMQKAPSGR